MRMKGLNNDDVVQSAVCGFIYASSPLAYSAWLRLAVALLDRQLKEALARQDFNINVLASRRFTTSQSWSFYLSPKIFYIIPSLMENIFTGVMNTDMIDTI